MRLLHKCYNEIFTKKNLQAMSIIILVGILLVTWLILSYPSKHVREKYIDNIFKIKGEEVTKILIEPYNPSNIENRNGVQKSFYITDRNKVNIFCKQLNMSLKYFPSHPATKWSCIISMFLKNKTIKFKVVQTANNQGFMIPVNSNVTSGWSYGFYRNDKLGKIILGAWESSSGRPGDAGEAGDLGVKP